VDLQVVFDPRLLLRADGKLENYELVRNMLAAYKRNMRFVLLVDERRPDLLREYLKTVGAVKVPDLRHRCDFVTWQELATVLPKKLRSFLATKYGIEVSP